MSRAFWELHVLLTRMCLHSERVLLIRAEDHRVLLGFWRGQLLRDIEPRLKAGGKYEMATLELREGDTVTSATVRRLVSDAVALNARLGDPTRLVRTGRRPRVVE